jgi:hypothetical protein
MGSFVKVFFGYSRLPALEFIYYHYFPVVWPGAQHLWLDHFALRKFARHRQQAQDRGSKGLLIHFAAP